MKKFLAIAGVVLALSISGCSTPGTLTGADVNTAVAQVQEKAKQICSFLPTATTVANILASLAGYGDAATAITSVAASICTSVTSKSAQRGQKPRVNGIAVQGRFVR